MADLHVVYIEDHPASLTIMQLLLRDVIGVEHVTLLESTDSLEGQFAKLDCPIDLILSDLNVYPIDGFEVCAWLRSQDTFQNIPIIGVTASVSPADMRRMQEVGFSGVITKPLSHTTFPVLFKRIMDGEAVWED